MQTYKVYVTRTEYKGGIVEVQAKCKEDAEDYALEDWEDQDLEVINADMTIGEAILSKVQ